MTDRDALLTAIHAAPDDDVPRLVFADWLDERGESGFAAFIRLEIERDRHRYGTKRWRAIDERVKAVRHAFPGHADGVLSPTRRGFHTRVQTDLFALANGGLDRIGPYSPRLEVLIGGDTQQAQEADAAGTLAAAARVFGSPWVRRWDGLELVSFGLTGELARAMTAPGHLCGLEVFHVRDGPDDEAVRAVCHADLPNLSGLGVSEVMRRFGWGDPQLTPAVVPTLLDSPLMPRLESLALHGDWLDDNGLRRLAATPAVNRLKTFYPWPRQGSGDGLRAVLRSPHLRGLTWLNLSRVELDLHHVTELADPITLPNLERLDVPHGLPRRLREPLRRRFGKKLRLGAEEDRQ